MNNKKITKTGTYVITTLETLIFSLFWYLDYNDGMFQTLKVQGFYSCLILWLMIYLWLCSLYRAFSFASTSVGETVFSQFISFGLADFVLYIVCVLLRREIVSLWSGIGCVFCQVGIAIVAIIIIKRILMVKMSPDKTVVFYGTTYSEFTAGQFVERLLSKYSHMFAITDIVFDNHDDKAIFKSIDNHDRVILLGVNYEHRKEIAKYCIDHHKVFYFVPEIEEIVFMSCDTKNLLDTPLKRYSFNSERFGYLFVKRGFDIVLSLILILLLWPIMLFIAIAIRLEDHGPAVFKQLRVTKDEKTFYMYKFRSMVMDADDVNKYGVRPTTDNDPRITHVGRFLRSVRMDELLQLFNILKGEMSFVGPRPERIEHVKKYEADLPEFKYRHMVRGGLTGYAQVFGKYNTSAEDKLKLDLLYIMNASLFTDLQLFLLTIRTVFQKESTDGFGIEQANTMNEGVTRRMVSIDEKSNACFWN